MEKKCPQCGLRKPHSEFYKNKLNKNGLQTYCKTCCKKNSKYFRDELRPDYYWGTDDSYFIKNREKNQEYIKLYYKADKSCKIYSIETPDGLYIGATKRNLNTRLNHHIKDFKLYQLDNNHKVYLPLLYQSLNKYPFEESYKMFKDAKILEEFEGTSLELKSRERKWIIKLHDEGYELLNVTHNPKYKGWKKKLKKVLEN